MFESKRLAYRPNMSRPVCSGALGDRMWDMGIEPLEACVLRDGHLGEEDRTALYAL